MIFSETVIILCRSKPTGTSYHFILHYHTPIHRADLRVPGAFRYGVLEVGTCESRARHKVDVLLGVEAHLL